ncbi:hypothetical protein CGSMWGv1500E_00885, partial [Gardnerella vaginalis 1500E]
VGNTSILRSVENNEKEPKNQHKTRNNNQNQQKITKNNPKNLKTGSVATPSFKQNNNKNTINTKSTPKIHKKQKSMRYTIKHKQKDI